MPESRRRRKIFFTPPPTSNENRGSPFAGRWVAPTMATLLILGLVWIVMYYIAGSEIPLVQDLGGWNLVIGMGLITLGFIVATKWK